jgi:cytochrome c peroxidase
LHCHGAGSALPWYHALPGIRALIDNDITRARRSVDLSHDFPFRGRGTQIDYLEEIEGVLDDGSMPPARYRLLHWGKAFNESEERIVREWLVLTKESLLHADPHE